ncbi:CrcB family protein [Microbacterium sp. AK031]|uniref:fluoride efflux transporter FluC n=1 Tax=Microbacterium sp. AK031 TaxID=2723076 RepID=UPI0021686DD9|nr:CrcB family protein [Microbacterium sp. AK031]MCS3843447.1 CrcB protein [Microbacterium sp. AK031]
MTLRRLLLVALGGTLGTAARLAIALSIPDDGGFPVATLAVNLIGAMLIGVLAARLPGSSDMRVFLGTGILGGFTTYSAFAVGTVQLWTETPLLAGLYAIVTLAFGIAAAVIGMRVGRRRDER